MFRALIISSVCVLALSFAAVSYAATDRYPADFSEMDLDKDGILTWEEFHAYYPELSKDAYDGADKENDGRVTPEEWTEFVNQPR